MMLPRAERAPLLACLLVGLLTGGCTSGGKDSGSSDHQELTYQYAPFTQLDPQHVSDGAPIAGQNLLEGMVTPDAAGTGVVAATADTWTVSADGTVYTFHVRRDARWSDGTPVTAQDFEWTYKRLLAPSTSALDALYGSSSYQVDLGIHNAVEYQIGEVADWSRVGVKALDPATLQIVLAAPNGSFLQGMAHTSMVPLPQSNLERYPNTWQTPAHWVGNGPFVMKSWSPDSMLVLVPNHDYWNRENVHLDRVNISTARTSDADAATRYKKGDIDIVAVGDPALFEKDATSSRALTRLDDFSVNFLTLIPSRNPALEDVRVRAAIALAIDRAVVAKAGPLVTPASSLLPSTLPGFDAGVGFDEDVGRARQLLAEAGYPGGENFPTLSIMTSHDDPYAQAVVDTLQHNLGITAVQDIEDLDVMNARRHEVQPDDFVGFFSTGYTGILTWRNWVSNLYPPTQTELLSLTPDDYTHYQVLQAEGTASSLSEAQNFLEAHANPQSRQFAALAAEADVTSDPDRATALYKQAAAIRQATYEFIPYAYGALVYAIRPGIEGVHLWTGYFTISFKGVTVSS
jgi:oligopeptide transport system substrate-binding protein